MEITNDDSILLTLADKRGYELVLKHDRLPEKVAALHEEFVAMNRRMEQLLLLPGLAAPGSRKR